MFTRGALLYIGQRLVLIVFTAVAVSSIVFLGVHRLPGDALLNERRPDPAAEAALLHYYHLDLPLPDQYVRYVTGLLHGDLGESYVNRGVQITPLLLREARVSAEVRSEEHTSELQSRFDLVCRLLLEKKKRLLGCGVEELQNMTQRSNTL